MRKIQIDLASPCMRRTLFRIPALACASGLVLLLLLPVVAVNISGYRDDLRRHDLALAAARARQAPVAAVVPVRHSPIEPGQAAVVNAAVMQLNLPWQMLKDAIQATSSVKVALLALDPDARKRTLRITAETKTTDDMIGYIELVKAQDCFAAVTLTRHEINEQDPNHPVRFQLDAQWRQP